MEAGLVLRFATCGADDIPVLRLNYTFEVRWRDEEKTWDLNRIERDAEITPRNSVTIQYRAFERTTVYFEARNPVGFKRRRDRERYDGSIADGVLLRGEISKRTIEPEYVIGLHGRF